MELLPTFTDTPIRTRIAPTPSGYLHLGNVLSFAITWALAKQQNGKVVLRIDDLDNARFREEYLHDIFDTLHFLGITYGEGPVDATDFYQNYSQQNNLACYNSMLQKLSDLEIVYACPCSRTQLNERIQEGNYPFTCRYKHLPLDLEKAAWRIRIPENTSICFTDLALQKCNVPLNEVLPDFVIRRKDGMPAYQIASLCDDIRLGINLIVRGQDLLSSTAAQLYLAQLTGHESYQHTKFLHHPVLYDANGFKLSKSHGALSIKEVRKRGSTAATIWQLIAAQLNIPAEVTDAKGFLENFNLTTFAASQLNKALAT